MKKVYLNYKNTIFKNSSIYNSINLDEFKQISKWYFDGFKLYKIENMEFIFKGILCHIIINNEIKLKIRFKYRDGTKVFYIGYNDKIPGIYESLNNFFKDVNNHLEDNIKLKEDKTLNEIYEKYPEYMI